MPTGFAADVCVGCPIANVNDADRGACLQARRESVASEPVHRKSGLWLWHFDR